MHAASTTAKNEIEIVSQDDENNSGKFFEPLHLAHQLNSAKKNSEEITQESVHSMVRVMRKQHLIDVCVVLREVEVQTQYTGDSCNHG